jgi:hypothetical protein
MTSFYQYFTDKVGLHAPTTRCGNTDQQQHFRPCLRKYRRPHMALFGHAETA